MARLTEEMVIARTRQSDLASVKKLNCWGAELGDVSLLRRMPNVEVLAFSLNKIRSLSEFSHLQRLRELYVRKNDVSALSEVRHLRKLPHLTALWLEDNPCADRPDYRYTVLRNLPRLQRLDDRPVQPDELDEAQRRGVLYADSDEEQDDEPGSPEEGWGGCSPERRHHDQSGEWAESGADNFGAPPMQDQAPQVSSPTRRGGGGGSPDSDERYDHPAALTRSYHERSANGSAEEERVSGAMRHSVSAHSVKVPTRGDDARLFARETGYRGGGLSQEYAGAANGEARCGSGVCSPATHNPYQEPYYERHDRLETQSTRGPTEPWDREQDRERERERPREYPSAVMAEHRGFTRRPVTRNSNLLSAVLCLVKELDYASLEVAEMAVRCRMDELAHGP